MTQKQIKVGLVISSGLVAGGLVINWFGTGSRVSFGLSVVALLVTAFYIGLATEYRNKKGGG